MENKFKPFFIFCIALLISIVSMAQKNPVKWRFATKKIEDKTYELHFTAEINSGWHLYSQSTPDGGPLPTQITINKNPLLIISGTPKELGKLETKFEEIFDVQVKYYSSKVDFVQLVKLKNNGNTTATGSIEFMACTDEQCLPPITINFNITLN